MANKIYVFFVLMTVLSTNVKADQDWEKIKNHGPHAGFVKMNKSKTLGIEVISNNKDHFQLFVLSSNYGPLDAADLKVSVSHSSNISIKNDCPQKDQYFDCPNSLNKNDGEQIFHVKSDSKKIDEDFAVQLPLS